MTNEGIKICAFEGFWLPLTAEIAGLAEAEGRDAGYSVNGILHESA